MHGQSPASPEGGRYLSRVGGGVVALGQTGERHPWISFFFDFHHSFCDSSIVTTFFLFLTATGGGSPEMLCV